MSNEATQEKNTVNLSALRRAVQQERERVDKIVTEKHKEIEDNKALIKRLDDLPKKLRHDIMVPIGNAGFMPGKIVKTNQVLMLVGDGYFVERSCFEANECLKRRVNVLKEIIADCEKEMKLINNQLSYAERLFAVKEDKGDEVEIMEPYDEEKEEEFKHKKEKRQARVQAISSQQPTASHDKDFMEKLAELELQEAANKELDDEEGPEIKPPPGVSAEEFKRLLVRLDEDDETSEGELLSDQDEEDEDEEEEKNIKIENVPSISQMPKKPRPEDLDSDDSLEEDVVVAPPIENAHSQKNRKKGVTFSSNIEASHHIRVDDPVTAVTKAVEFVSGHTDSILRNKDTKSPLDENAIAAIKAAESGPRVVPSSLTAFPGQVVERGVVDYCSQEPSTSAVEPTKPISKFKRQRAKN